MKKKEIDIAKAENLVTYQEKTFGSKNGSLLFKHFRQLTHTAISPHLERKDESARSSEARANLLIEFFAIIQRETSATTMREYTESASVDLKICRDGLSRIAKKLVKYKARGIDAIPPILYVRTAGTHTHSPLYNVYRNNVRTSQFPLKWKEAKVIPVFKKGSQTKVEIYRPISLVKILRLYSSDFWTSTPPYAGTILRFLNWLITNLEIVDDAKWDIFHYSEC